MTSAGGGVTDALRVAARATGVDFDYLLRTAQRESAMNPRAQARTSSAAGLFQFIDQTWLATLRRHGERHGYGAYARNIVNEGGRWRTTSPEARQAVMALRLDPRAASLMAAELTNDSAAYLRGRIGRDPTGGELYAAHFLGPAGCARLVTTMQANPEASAVALFPDAASANRSIFYRSGRPATVSEVYSNLMRRHEGGPLSASPRPPVDVIAPANTPAVDEPEETRTPTLAAALARIRAQQAMVAMILGQGESGLPFSGRADATSPLQALMAEVSPADSGQRTARAQTLTGR